MTSLKLRDKDAQMPKYIKNSEGRLLTNDLNICNRWLEYCRNILHEEFPRTVIPEEEPSHEPVPRFTKEEVNLAVKAMGNGKALGPECTPSEFWKEIGEVDCEWLAILFNSIKVGNPMPENWRSSYLIPLYKGKGDSRECNNYRSIKLMSHTMKIYERVLNSRLRQIVTLDENQCGFVEGKSTLDAIQSLTIIIEKYRDSYRNLHMVFIDLEKAFDRVPRDLIWTSLRSQKVPEIYVKIIMDMYENASTMVKCPAGTHV